MASSRHAREEAERIRRFHCCSGGLIRGKYTNPSRLAIRGYSNGGLLVGAAMTQRPDLFRAVVCEHPDLDIVGARRDSETSTSRRFWSTAMPRSRSSFDSCWPIRHTEAFVTAYHIRRC
jgi:dipeptidyl aminopeptidase/acylaminoacyl peptidase